MDNCYFDGAHAANDWDHEDLGWDEFAGYDDDGDPIDEFDEMEYDELELD